MALEPLLVPFGTLLKPQYRKDLILHHKYNVNAGVICPDISDYNNDGLLTNFNWNATSGWAGQGLRFDGSNNYVVTASNIGISGTANRTITFWAKVNSIGGHAHLVEWGNLGLYQMFGATIYAPSPPSGTWYFWGYARDWNTTIAVETGKWLHHVLTYNGTQVRWFINGKELGTGATLALNTGNTVVDIGREKTSTNYFNGIIDDVRIYNRALSADEIAHSCSYQEDEWDLGLDDDIDIMQNIPQKMNAYKQMRA